MGFEKTNEQQTLSGNRSFDSMMSMWCVAELSTEVSMLSSQTRPVQVQSPRASSVNTNSPLAPKLPVQTTSCTANETN